MRNTSNVPTDLLSRLVAYAADRIGVNVPAMQFVKARNRYGAISGYASPDDAGDFIKVRIPTDLSNVDIADFAYGLFKVVAHELGHVRDYVANRNGANLEFTHYRNATSMRAMNHDDRPQEQRADSYVAAIVHTAEYDDIIGQLIEFLTRAKLFS